MGDFNVRFRFNGEKSPLMAKSAETNSYQEPSGTMLFQDHYKSHLQDIKIARGTE